MKMSILLLGTAMVLSSVAAEAQGDSKVDFDAFQKLAAEARKHRASRLLPIDQFVKAGKEPGVIILDTRSDSMYKRKHVKGAIHLNFSDFTQENLAKVIPSTTTKILIYCNNNFDRDPVNFATKSVQPSAAGGKELTLALNIPTYINLYGYGYRNVYELSGFVSVFDKRIEFEGTDVPK